MMVFSLLNMNLSRVKSSLVASGDKIVTDNLGQTELQANDFTHTSFGHP